MVLSFPVLARLVSREEGTAYRLRPLFIPVPHVQEERYERAQQLLRKEVRRLVTQLRTRAALRRRELARSTAGGEVS